MSLQRYCQAKRMVVLSSHDSAYEAARALENNHIGVIIVEEAGELVGVATDRDLALRVTGRELDPKRTPLRDVMTPDPVTLGPDDSEHQAATLMRAKHLRRIPIVDDGGVVGIVTLDDLILSRAVDIEMAGDIIDAELAEPSPGKPPGVPYPLRPPSQASDERRAARAGHKLRELGARLESALGLSDSERALTAFSVVAQGLVRRLTRTEAADFVAQLPAGIKDRLRELPAGPDRSVSLKALAREIADRLEVDEERGAHLVRRVAAVLPEFVSPGELQDVVGQLPNDMKAVFQLGTPIDRR